MSNHDLDGVNENPEKKQELSKEEKLAKEKAKFLEKFAAGDTNHLQTKVAWVLNRYPSARDSDVTLQVQYWRTFNRELLSGPNTVTLENLYKLTRLTDIARARAKIQNEYHLFQASEGVRKRRVIKEGEERERQIDNPPPIQTLTVYSDESGKTENFLIVGSVWFLIGDDVHNVDDALNEWRERTGFKEELHFTKINDRNIDRYMEVINILDTFAATISFRAITIERRGHGDIPRVLDDLLLHLIVRGVRHEHESGRAPLPRSISIFKDAEEEARDKLSVANLELTLKNVSKAQFNNQLHVSLVYAIDSKTLIPIQLADLFIGSLNRTLNVAQNGTHAKDRFAAAFLARFGGEGEQQRYEQGGDMTVIDRV
ncbi:MAG TPA: DUF3800 domain-containing protein [Dyella sp.]|uniref:DUF3800 domain-containing protein n=1 Tax=Dyella sp. TaxID=1869338 RepID=UPI002BBD7E37|nr:DUF3800 domain-containing protein [Dyella sp.]HTV86964.1 DUF3800 domain-containing protein [Dyella sp.]